LRFAARDRGTRLLIALALGAAIGTAVAQSRPAAFPRAAGILMMWLGLAVRVWAIAALGGTYRVYRRSTPARLIPRLW
jgi:protein-S-isoprenylcysteine O-methyltransferase Ste14